MSRALFEEVMWDSEKVTFGRLAHVPHVPGWLQDPKLEACSSPRWKRSSGAGRRRSQSAAAIRERDFRRDGGD